MREKREAHLAISAVRRCRARVSLLTHAAIAEPHRQFRSQVCRTHAQLTRGVALQASCEQALPNAANAVTCMSPSNRHRMHASGHRSRIEKYTVPGAQIAAGIADSIELDPRKPQ
jgi:hypothetical protein